MRFRHAQTVLLVGALLLLLVVPIGGGGLPGGGKRAERSVEFLNVIVQGPDLAALDRAVAQVGGRVSRRFPFISALAAQVPADRLALLASRPEVTQVTPDRTVVPALREGERSGSWEAAGKKKGEAKAPETGYPTVVGAPYVWEQGYTGEGIGVAVLDSGIQPMAGLK